MHECSIVIQPASGPVTTSWPCRNLVQDPSLHKDLADAVDTIHELEAKLSGREDSMITKLAATTLEDLATARERIKALEDSLVETKRLLSVAQVEIDTIKAEGHAQLYARELREAGHKHWMHASVASSCWCQKG